MKLTKNTREQLRVKFEGCCAYCGSELPARGWHAEPIEVELVPGGIVPVCTECRTSKGNASAEVFRQLLKEQVDRAQRHSVNFRTAMRFGLVSETAAPVVFWFERHRCERAKVLHSTGINTHSYSQSVQS